LKGLSISIGSIFVKRVKSVMWLEMIGEFASVDKNIDTRN